MLKTCLQSLFAFSKPNTNHPLNTRDLCVSMFFLLATFRFLTGGIVWMNWGYRVDELGVLCG